MLNILSQLRLVATTRFLLFGLLLFLVFPLHAQVGIGTTTPKAALQITSPNSGVLIPKYATLALANTNSLTALNATDHIGMMIYVDEAANQGFWFYNGSGFEKVGSRVIPSQSGNAGNVLTTDGTTTSWQKPASRTRSIVLDMGSIDVSTEQNSSPPTKSRIGSNNFTPVIGFVDEGDKSLITQIPIPADWNRTSPLQLTLYYSSPATSGDFSFIIGGKFMSLNTNITTDPLGNNVLYPTNSTPNGLTKKTISLSFISGFSETSEVLHLVLQRRTGATDTATGSFNLLGMRIDYQD